MGEQQLADLPEIGPHAPRRIDATPADARLLDATMEQAGSWPRYEEISSHSASELDDVISKPWGHEYRIYRDPFFDIWLLTIGSGHSTSEHCHPRKSTALICLSGEGYLRVQGHAYRLSAGDIVVIGRGVFHLTKNIGTQPLEVIEVEVPRNKFDLVRAEDSYGRKASPYSDPTMDEIEVAAMVSTPLQNNAKYRPLCATGSSFFDVVLGNDLTHRDAPRDGSLYAALSLATSCALNDTIMLTASTVGWPDAVDPAGIYFTIVKATAQAESSERARCRAGSRSERRPGGSVHRGAPTSMHKPVANGY